jgi:hypothetical protein
MRRERRSERGQATVEWTGLLLLVALALLALSQLAPKADGQELGTTVAHSVTRAAASAGGATGSMPGVVHKSVARRQIFSTHPAPATLRAVVRPSLPRLPRSLGRIGRGAGAVWRRAWFACLVYQRIRYALRHPEISVPGYTLPYGTALRIINGCVSPVDLLHDLPELDPAP